MAITAREVTERLDALKQENARLKRSLRVRTWAGAAGLGLVALWSFVLVAVTDLNRRIDRGDSASLPKIIEAEGFVVRDTAGAIRATLGRTGHATDDRHAETGLQLWTNGKQRGALTVDGHGWGALTFADQDGNTRLSLIGESSDAGLVLYDKNQDMRLGLSLYDDGGTNLHLYGKNLGPRVQFGVQSFGQERPFFDAFDANGEAHPLIGGNGLPLVGPGPK